MDTGSVHTRSRAPLLAAFALGVGACALVGWCLGARPRVLAAEDRGGDQRSAERFGDEQRGGGARDDGAAHVALQSAAIDALVAQSKGAWDSFPDPDVGRVLQPGLRARAVGGIAIDTNRFGQRERDYAVPKPTGVTRIVLLGDSFVYGNAVAAELRLGAVLERELAARAGERLRVECLHIGVVGWNLRAECEYLRRSLSALEPDLVVHVSVANDLEDASDARGFGVLATFSSQQRQRADGIVAARIGQLLDPDAHALLNACADWESRTRYAEGARELERLAEALASRGARYLVLFHWPHYQAKVRESLAAGLRDLQIAWLPSSLGSDARYRVSPSDEHWNAAGHAYIAQLLYGLLRERRLLGDVDLPAWDEADSAVRALHEAGRREADAPAPPFIAKRALDAQSRIDTRRFTNNTAGQVHAGLDRHGLASPYVSVLLANPRGARVRVRGRRLARGELDGAARVYVDEHELGRFALAGDEPIECAYELPSACASRAAVSVRIASDDWVYDTADLRHTISFALDEVGIER